MASFHIGFVHLTVIAASLGLTYILTIIVYNIFFHPLRSFPGPLANRASNIPRVYHLVHGNLFRHVADLHHKYGPVVRISPDSLAFVDPQAWKDIYGHRTHGEEEFVKDGQFYRLNKQLPESIISTRSRETHGIIRRKLAHGFSERSLRDQESIIGAYVDLLILRLHENTAGGATAQNMREWLNWATFDIIGDLAFGSSFGCLDNSTYHPWVRLITDAIKSSVPLHALILMGLKPLAVWMQKIGAQKASLQHRELVRAKLRQRIELGAERPDLIEGLIKKKDGWDMPFDQLSTNASTLIIAGSETTATLLCGAVFLLTTNPEALKRLEHEVRSTFKDDSEITLNSVHSLDYMLACLDESFRRYPPIASGMPRVSPKGGAMVAGHFIPEGTKTAVWQWAANHHPSLWTDPEGFHPERFMKDPRFKEDKLDAMQPFSLGPRNCIGRNLAYAEMRLILAKIIFNFDMRLADDSRGWLDGQKAYIVWDKPALNVYLTPVAQ